MSAEPSDLSHRLPTAEQCLLWEQQCFADFTGTDGPRLLLWQSAQALVVSRSDQRLPGFDEARKIMSERGWPVVLRRSGGTAVPQGPGMLNITWLTDPGEGPSGLRRDYERFADMLLKGLASLELKLSIGANPGSWCDGDFNLQCNGLKVGGTAQRRAGSRVMCQLALAVSMPNQRIVDAVNAFYEAAGSEFRAEAASSTCLQSQRTKDAGLIDWTDFLGGLIESTRALEPRMQTQTMGMPTQVD